jgi:sigma-E factor negative regulatory protein RseB
VLLRLLVVSLLCFTVAVADEKPITPQQWLEKMNVAMKILNYQGTVIFMKNGQLDTMNIGIALQTVSSRSVYLR